MSEPVVPPRPDVEWINVSTWEGPDEFIRGDLKHPRTLRYEKKSDFHVEVYAIDEHGHRRRLTSEEAREAMQ